MKKGYFLSTCFLFAALAHAQTAFWSEDFGTGCNRGQSPAAFSSVNGAWTETTTGTNDSYADLWFVSATAAGTGGGNCSDNCSFMSTTNQSLHIGNAAIPLVSFGADTGSTYLTGTFCGAGICSTTHKRVESPIINCLGKQTITVSFTYYEGGELGGDEGTFWYSPDAGVTWNQVDALPKTTVGPCTLPSASWVEYSVVLPMTANSNPNVKIGFNWTNDNDGQGSDPSFAVDDVVILYDQALGVAENFSDAINVTVIDGNVITVQSPVQWTLVSVTNMLGQPVYAEREGTRVFTNESAEGIYLVTLEVNGVRVVKKVML